jgi:dTDP-4-dehydrorhamnose reductase
MNRKLVVFGHLGQLGVELMRVFRERGWDISGFDRGELDVCDRAKVEQIVGSTMPSLVINATAYNAVDVAESEPDAAMSANGLAVRNMALACRQADARFVHFSTDYVFDGTLGRAYTEDDRPHPLGAYGVSKLAGEFYAQAYLESPLVIRTSGVFGPAGMYTARGNFVETMLRLAQRREPIRVVEDYVASPTYSPELARCTADMVDGTLTGLFHVGGGEAVSWFDYARIIFEEAGVKPELRPTTAREHRSAASRPRYSALSNERMQRAGIRPMPPLRDCIRDYMKRRTALLNQRPPG